MARNGQNGTFGHFWTLLAIPVRTLVLAPSRLAVLAIPDPKNNVNLHPHFGHLLDLLLDTFLTVLTGIGNPVPTLGRHRR